MTPLPTVIAAINAAMLMMVRTATATSNVRPSSCGREHIRRKLTRSRGTDDAVLLMFGREGRRMTARNVANDSLWRTESHPRTTCYRRCPADPGGSRRGPLLWPTSPRLCVERIRWHALASRWLTQVIFSLSYNRQAALPWGASGWSHPMRRGSGAQPRSTGQGRGPCESRHGVVLQAIPGLAA
jgi:hypothetical protein